MELQPFYLLLSFTIFTLLLIKWTRKSSPSTKTMKLPPAPPTLPVLGNLHQLGLYSHKSLLSLSQKYGPLMLLKFGTRPVVVASTSEFASAIMKTHDLSFSDRPKFDTSDKLLYQSRDVSTAPYGEYWRQMRSICVLKLLSNKRVLSFGYVREEETEIFMHRIRESASSSLPVNLSEMFACYTNDVVCRIALGRKYSEGEGEGGKKFKLLLGDLMELLGSFTLGNFIPSLSWLNSINGFDAKVDRVAKEFDEFLDGVLEEHMDRLQKNGEKNSGREDQMDEDDEEDFVDVMLNLRKDHTAPGFSLDLVNIKAMILDMFAAGTDTTYTVLEWVMSELLRNPNIMKKVQDEVRGIGDPKHNIKDFELDKIPYLRAVIKETLRLYPPIPLLVPRSSTLNVKLKDYDIPAGTPVFTNAWAIGRDPETWDEPEEFVPERFLQCSTDFRGHHFELIPFGAGRRGCPGIGFASATVELLLANLVRRFDWGLPGGTNGEDLDMTQCPGLTIHRKVPLVVVATPSF